MDRLGPPTAATAMKISTNCEPSKPFTGNLHERRATVPPGFRLSTGAGCYDTPPQATRGRPMALAVAIQMDPIESIDIEADSTFALALEAQRRGHVLYHFLPRQLSLKDGRLTARARRLELRRE